MADSAFGADEMPFLRDFLKNEIMQNSDMTKEEASALIDYCREYGVSNEELVQLIEAKKVKDKLIWFRLNYGCLTEEDARALIAYCMLA